MIAGLVQILLFQGLGEIVARFFLPLIPGPGDRARAAPRVAARARKRPGFRRPRGHRLRQNLGLLFIPAAVGVVMFWPHIRSHALAVVAALVVSVVATMAVTALVLRAIAKDGEP